jgi:hypothetical protein
MKKLLIFILFSVTFSAVSAQGEQPSKFSPKDFECQLKQFIIKEAGLTPQEASNFFPVYREMQKKQSLWTPSSRMTSIPNSKYYTKCFNEDCIIAYK